MGVDREESVPDRIPAPSPQKYRLRGRPVPSYGGVRAGLQRDGMARDNRHGPAGTRLLEIGDPRDREVVDPRLTTDTLKTK